MDKVINKYNSDLAGKYIFVKDVQYVSQILWSVMKVINVVSENEEYPYYEFDKNTFYELSETCGKEDLTNNLKAVALKYLHDCKDNKEKLQKIIDECDDLGNRYHICYSPNCLPKPSELEPNFYIFNSHFIYIISEEEYNNIVNEFKMIHDKKVSKVTRKYF